MLLNALSSHKTAVIASVVPAAARWAGVLTAGRDVVAGSDKNKGWLKPGKYPAKMSAPIDIGARVDGNAHDGTIMGHMNGARPASLKPSIKCRLCHGSWP